MTSRECCGPASGIVAYCSCTALARRLRGADPPHRPGRPVGRRHADPGTLARAIPAPPLSELSLRMNAARTAIVMYMTRRSSWISLGDPMGPDAERAELAWQFCELCDSHGGWPVFYQTSADLVPLYVDLGLMVLRLGTKPALRCPISISRVPLGTIFARRTPAQVAAGCTFELATQESAKPLWQECQRLRDEWRAIHGADAHEQAASSPLSRRASARRPARRRAPAETDRGVWTGLARERAGRADGRAGLLRALRATRNAPLSVGGVDALGAFPRRSLVQLGTDPLCW